LANSPCDSLGPELPVWSEIKVYPNPTTGDLKVYLPFEEGTNFSYGLYNSIGQRLISADKTIDGSNELNLALDYLPAAIYILHIVQEEQEWHYKIFLE